MLAASVQATTLWQYGGDSFDSFYETINSMYPWRGHPTNETQAFRWKLNLALLAAAERSVWRLTVGHFSTTADFVNDPNPDGRDIVLIVPVHGKLIFHFKGGDVDVVPGEAIVYQALNVHYSEQFIDASGTYEINYLKMSFACVQAYLSKVLHFPVDHNLQLQSKISLADVRGQMLASLVAAMSASAFVQGSRDFSPSLQQRVIETFCQLVLETVDHRYSHRAQKERVGPLPGHVWMARDYIHRRLLSDPKVEDIAAAVGVSLRTLELAFRVYMDVTPTVYMRTLRLHMARKALRSDDTRTIAQIGKAFGFAHTGRFAGYYFDLFGETPSETRRDWMPESSLSTVQSPAMD